MIGQLSVITAWKQPRNGFSGSKGKASGPELSRRLQLISKRWWSGSAACFHVKCINRVAAGHGEAALLGTVENEVRATLRKTDEADGLTLRILHRDAVGAAVVVRPSSLPSYWTAWYRRQ